ncbi:DUF1153 domain-containing protein [Altererythrobacter litoralis]|uniref:DUF1153 domain-containing protein n=1 Tax=Altererythrobacter litoralis TaxID=3113904 RepID=A0ABU7GDU0_9SPHN|nr:DUF1153 domain-containing protein [Erythrobacteraceae bacterium 1XM1-14]
MPYAPHETVADAIKRAALPTTHRIYWSAARKAEVVRAVRKQVISFAEARERYLLSHSEFREWEDLVDRRHRDEVQPKRPPEAVRHKLEEA